MKSKIKLSAIAVAMSLGLAACDNAPNTEQTSQTQEAVAQAEAVKLESGIDLSARDTQVRAQDDFFKYVSGGWLARTEIPADRSRYSMFNLVYDENQEKLKDIIQSSAESNAAKGTNAQKLGDMYSSYMNETLINELGYQPLMEQLNDIKAITNLSDVAKQMGALARISVDVPIDFAVFPDAKNPGFYGMWLGQGGLTLPDKDYYFKDEEKFATIREELAVYVEAMLEKVGYANPDKAAANVMQVEALIAEHHQSREASRDIEKAYNKRTAEEFVALVDGFDWAAYSEGMKLGEQAEMIVTNYPFVEKFGEIFTSVSPEAWKDYLTFHLLDAYAPRLSQEFVDLNFGFHSTTVRGVPENLPRWKRGVATTSQVLGEVLGQEYVALHFDATAKEKMDTLVTNLIKAYGQSIKDLEWMSDTTKEKALEKLSKFKPKIGYPAEWRDYSDLVIEPNDLIGNSLRYSTFSRDFNIARIGKPIDPVDWGMSPQTVNAYYNPTTNEIVFPAGILQPPFFNLDADDAVNYGGIGGVIGHEIGHGFDDQGSKFDGDGNLQNWWTEEDRVAFDALGDKLAAQYDQFSPLEGMNVNGRLTLGENIGDLAGVVIGLKAYQLSLEGKEAPVIDGYTGEQRFFMGWAQVWRGKMRDDSRRAQLLSDPHSPELYRVMGPLRNVDAFYEAFDVKEGDEMYLPPEERVTIW